MSTFPVSGTLAEGGVVTVTIDEVAYDVVVTATGATIWVSTDGTIPVARNPNTAHRVPVGAPVTVPVAITTGTAPTVIKLISEGAASYVIARSGPAPASPGGGGVASDVAFTPAGGIAATDVQAALEELDTEKATTAALTAHASDSTAVHGIADTADLVTGDGITTIVALTQAAYDALSPPAATTLYVIVAA